jgi:TonB-linked SusC/RagA family outer membrane protein
LGTVLVCAGRRVRFRALLLAMLAWAATASAQEENRIHGRVVDAGDQTPIPTAQVQVTGTTVGQPTGDSGTFSFRLPTNARTFTVRRIGYLAQTVPIVAGKTDYTVALQRDVLRLEAQVVTGVATTVSSQNAANDVAVVTAQDVTQVPTPTVEDALQGNVPGAVIEANNGGQPGGGVQVEVRGVTSIYGNAEPLYVVDGVIVNNETVNSDIHAIAQGTSNVGNARTAPDEQDNGINRIADLNPDDIESLEVLKGASASAIYGSKASAGVIIITTKRGTSGKPTWQLNTQVGHFADANSIPLRRFPTLASAQAWYIGDVTHHTAPAQVAGDNAFIQGIYAGPQNYQSELFSSPQASYQANVSVSGTAGRTQYFLSGLSKYDNGTQINTGYNKQSFRSNITQQLSSALSVTANVNYIHDVTRDGISGNDNIGISPYDVFSYTPQFMALNRQSPDGAWQINPFGPANPFADAAEIQTPQQVSRFIGGGNINWTPWRTDHQSVQINIVGGADLSSLQDVLYAPPTLQVEQAIPTGLPGTSVANSSQNNYFNYSINLIHHYTGVDGIDATTSIGFARERRDLTNPITVGQNLLAGVASPTAGTSTVSYYYRTAQRDQSLYAQEQVITLASRLAVTAGVTAERSTNDGNIDKFYAYPRYSASYLIPQFVGFLNELKVRAAYGQSGNLAPYGQKYSPFITGVEAGQNVIESNSALGDPALKPESEQEAEVGFDATMLHSRAQFSATVYQKRLTNLLLEASVAPTQGYSTVFENGGEFTNQGIELSLQGTPIEIPRGLTWTATASFYRNYSVVNALPVPAFVPANGAGPFGEDLLTVGRSLTEVVNPNVVGADGNPTQIGDFNPSDYLTLGNTLSWHRFRVYGLVVWSRGGNVENLTDPYYDFDGFLGTVDSAAQVSRLSSWLSGGQPYVKPGGFFKVREITLSYTLPESLVNQLSGKRVTNARVSLSGFNLWMVTNYDGLDPEVTALGAQTIGRGVDVTPYPPSRSYFLGLTLGF